MKKVIALVLMSMMLSVPVTACTQAEKEAGAKTAISTVKKTGSLAAAKKYLADVKAKMAKTVKPEYFKSKEWKMFVDAFWKGYNDGQKQMKNPEYMPKNQIKY